MSPQTANRILLVFVAALAWMLFLITPAPAAEPPELIAQCQTNYSSLAAIQACVNDLRFGRVAQAQAASDDRLAKFEDGQAGISNQLSGIEKSLDELRDLKQIPQTTPPVASQGHSTGRTPAGQGGGAPYRVVSRPSLVSVHAALAFQEADTLHVTELAHRDSARQCGGIVSGARVLITNHGVPVSVWAPEGAPSGFEEVYADMNGDARPDPGAYKTLDPQFQDDFYVTWRAGDDIRVVYLREAGNVVAIPSLPLQTLWRSSTHEDSTPRACRPATASAPGGHKVIQAYALWSVW